MGAMLDQGWDGRRHPAVQKVAELNRSCCGATAELVGQGDVLAEAGWLKGGLEGPLKPSHPTIQLGHVRGLALELPD